MYEDLDSFKNQNFFTEGSKYNFIQKKKENKENSASVANCIRALTHKTSALVQENTELRFKLTQMNEELKKCQEHFTESSARFQNIVAGYKEKCLALEQSNEIHQKKICRLLETVSLHDNLKHEMVLLNKELTKEIEKNQKLILENNKLKDTTVSVQNSYHDLTEMLRKSTSNKDSFDDYRVRGSTDNQQLLESLLSKQQSELQSKANTVQVLKTKLAALENSFFQLKKEKHNCEIQLQSLTDTNFRLQTTLKKKHHVCKHRSSTPDIALLPHPSKPTTPNVP